MSVVGLLILAVLVCIVFLKTIRWMAIVQQKEYRFDRLWLFLQTNEGAHELYRMTSWHDLSRTGMKRPKRTLRSIGTTVLTVLTMVAFSYVTLYWIIDALVFWKVLAVGIILWLIVPCIAVFFAIIPGLIVRVYSLWLLSQAAQKIARVQPRIIGITGSYGKTATKLLLAHVLAHKYSVFTPPRSHNTILSISQSILQSYLDQEIAIIEYAAYKQGEIGVLAGQLHPTVAILTGLTEQHLGLFGSLTQIITAKSELVAALQPGSTVYCANPAGARIAGAVNTDQLSVCKIWEHSPVGGKLRAGKLELQFGKKKILTQVVGMQYLDTVRTVYQVALDLGLSSEQIEAAIASFRPPSGYTKLFKTRNGLQVLDDGGTSNPAGFIAALELATELPGSEKVLISSGIVDLGERSAPIHRELAERARAVVQEVWYVGQVGQAEFSAVFGNRCITEQAEITRRLAQLAPTALLVIEGRMPAWFTKMV